MILDEQAKLRSGRSSPPSLDSQLLSPPFQLRSAVCDFEAAAPGGSFSMDRPPHNYAPYVGQLERWARELAIPERDWLSIRSCAHKRACRVPLPLPLSDMAWA